MDLQLTGKRALVTGSNTGIGKGIAKVFASEGVAVMVHGRKADRAEAVAAEIRAAGGVAHVALGDLAEDEGAASVIKATQEKLGGVDILVNNIGGTESAGSAKAWFDIKPEHWGGTMQQNVVSGVRMIHAFVPGMRERGWGRVINISSAGGTSATEMVPDYCAAKAAVINLTVSLSKTLARTGITVNTVSPGCTRTEMLDRTLNRLAAQHGWPDDYDARESLFMDLGIFPCASKHYGVPEDVGALVAYLASPLAAFVNGANYRIDGGQVQSVN